MLLCKSMIIDYRHKIFDNKKHILHRGDLLIFTFANKQVPILILNVNQHQHCIDGEVFDIEDNKLIELTGKEPWANLICVIRNAI